MSVIRRPSAHNRRPRQLVVVTDALWLGLITLAGAVLRLIWLNQFPPGLHFDEAVYGLLASDVYHGARPIFFSAYTGREPLYMCVMALVFHVTGIRVLGIRLTSALIGTATIPLAYLVMWEVHRNRRLALITAALVAVAYWHLTVSRNGYPNILIPPLECLALTFLWRGYRDGGKRWLALGGAFIGLTLYTYLAARLFPITVALCFTYAFLADRRRFLSRVWGIALAAAISFLVFAPLGYHFITHPHDFLERANQVLAVRAASGWEVVKLCLGNVAQTAGGFFVRGDPRWHYNLPGRPIFDPLMAVCFVLGLGVAVIRGRQPEYALLPIWVVGMSLPAILTQDLMPQGQRMFGIIPAVFALAALGLDTAVTWAGQRANGAPRHWLAAGLVALLAAEGGLTAHSYFRIWSRRPQTYYAFHTEYQRLAEQAGTYLDAGATVVILSHHYKHPTAVFTVPRTVDAIWVAGRKSLPLPSRGPGPTVYLIPLADNMPDAAIRRVLRQVAERAETLQDPFGRDSIAVYRLTAEALSERAARPAVATISDEIDILGSEVPEDLRRDGPLRVQVHWRALRPVGDGRNLTLHLVDAHGTLWGQDDETGYLSGQWRAGDTVYQVFEVPLPPGIPAGRYTPRLILAHEGGEQLPVVQGGKITGTALALGTVILSPEGGTVRPVARDALPLGPALTVLTHTTGDDTVVPGGTIRSTVVWQARVRPAEDHQVHLTLVAADGSVAAEYREPLAYDYPTSLWQPGEVVQATYALPLGPIPAGEYQLWLTLEDTPATLLVGTVRVASRERLYDVPTIQHPRTAILGGAVELLGYDLAATAYQPMDTLFLRLYWRARGPVPRDYKVFVHVSAADEHIWIQDDSVPAGWQRPTMGWEPGEIIIDEHALVLPADIPPGVYTLYAGLYDSETFQRLPITEAAGRVATDDRLPLLTITVMPDGGHGPQFVSYLSADP